MTFCSRRKLRSGREYPRDSRFVVKIGNQPTSASSAGATWDKNAAGQWAAAGGTAQAAYSRIICLTSTAAAPANGNNYLLDGTAALPLGSRVISAAIPGVPILTRPASSACGSTVNNFQRPRPTPMLPTSTAKLFTPRQQRVPTPPSTFTSLTSNRLPGVQISSGLGDKPKPAFLWPPPYHLHHPPNAWVTGCLRPG